jgi:hypothetical protein
MTISSFIAHTKAVRLIPKGSCSKIGENNSFVIDNIICFGHGSIIDGCLVLVAGNVGWVFQADVLGGTIEMP